MTPLNAPTAAAETRARARKRLPTDAATLSTRHGTRHGAPTDYRRKGNP